MDAVVKKEDSICIVSSDSDAEDMTSYLRELPQLLTTAPISNQPPSNSSCWQVVRTSNGVFVACPVCKIQVRSGLLLKHMDEHPQQISQSRPCQLCVDQGYSSTRVAPERLGFHILHCHIHGHLPSSPAPQPSTRATAAPLPVQPNPADQSMPTPAPSLWRFRKTGVRKLRMVICPFTQSNCGRVKPQNLVKHMRKVHQVGPEQIQLMRRQCQGCKQAVSPGELLAHTGCKKPTSPPSSLPSQSHIGPSRPAEDLEWTDWVKRVQLKRKATTSV